ncbi:transposase [Dehalobacter sp. UNSWDHB]|uniref:helix-turn-helix domain-containing protein n=1 Tax=Dehalobacter sp. UNSWDHB TaxID=1339256 RepID=UPI000387711B|nr:helix-turn-helix domain-containing protein [Dehalobacter sp. UNSWDHB]EQB21879.1 transposase [Dehalobacter sp. UNSWDHB]
MVAKGQKLKHYSGDFKVSAVEEVLNDHMGQRETARKYGVTHKMIQTWMRLYLEKGKDSLYRNASKDKETLISEIPTAQELDKETAVKTRRPRCSKVDESSLPDEVQKELNKLRMENEYLKKLNALVRKKEKSQTRIKLK